MPFYQYFPDPLAKFLTELPGAPLNLKPALNVWPLFILAGGDGPPGSGHRVANLWWETQLRTDSMLRAWIDSPLCFRSPDRWPDPVADVLPPWVTPGAFARAVLPDDPQTDRSAFLHHCVGLGTLSAHAHGWPLFQEDVDRGVVAARWLMNNPLFTVWAYDLNTSIVPVPFGDAPLYKRMRAAEELVSSPLSLGTLRLNRALPESLRTAEALRARLPRRSEGVGPCNRRPRLLTVDGKSVSRKPRRDGHHG